MERNQVETVKIYFINTIDIISVIINTLVEIEYEAYTINGINRNKLLQILTQDIRNVIFISILNSNEVDYWLEYIKELKKVKGTHILIGVFVYDNMDLIKKERFLIENVAVINFSEIKKSPLQIMKKILIFFEARGKRAYVKTKAYGLSEVYFYIKNTNQPITGKIISISAYAFSCEIDEMYKAYFETGAYFNEVLLVLKGMRIKTALKIIGFSKDNPNLYMMKFCSTKIEGKKLNYTESISRDINHKIHDYIRVCLKENIIEKFNEIHS